MRNTAFPILVFITGLFVSTHLCAQPGKNFNAEMNALFQSRITEIKGAEKEKQQGATLYEVKLKLSGFDLTYAETIFGNDLQAVYPQPGSMELMDLIYTKLAEKNFIIADSKTDPKIIGKGIFASDLKRKMTVKSSGTAQWRANITLNTADKIQIVFIKE